MKKSDLREITHRVAKRTTQLGYKDWDWGDGVAWHGAAQTAISLGDAELLSACVAWVHSHANFQPTSVRHVMPGQAALAVYRANGDRKALELALRVGAMLEHHPRNIHGVHAESREIPVWVDYWYEIAPFLTALSKATGDSRYADWAVEQSIAYLLSSWDVKNALFHHAYYDLIHENSQWFWARSNGWVALAMVEMLTDLKAVPGLTAILRNALTRLAARLAGLQATSGLWHTVLDHESTYFEPSASVMIALALRRGAKRGYLDASYSKNADRAFEACIEKIDAAGNLTGVSAETPPGDITHYAAIPLGVYPWGQGFMALAGLEWLADQ
jgi:unsaturated rhamnogalacturonyl hydrolase